MRNIYQSSKLQGPYSKYLRLINISILNLYIMIYWFVMSLNDKILPVLVYGVNGVSYGKLNPSVSDAIKSDYTVINLQIW